MNQNGFRASLCSRFERAQIDRRPGRMTNFRELQCAAGGGFGSHKKTTLRPAAYPVALPLSAVALRCSGHRKRMPKPATHATASSVAPRVLAVATFVFCGSLTRVPAAPMRCSLAVPRSLRPLSTASPTPP